MKPKEMIMKRTTSAKTFVITIATALALGMAPWAMADEKGCSEETLKGSFAYTSTGFILVAKVAALAGPSAEVGTVIFDGNGGVTFSFNSSLNGNIGPGNATGKYTVNSEDCTGTFTHIVPATATSPAFTSNYSFVIDERGDEYQAICQDSGVVATEVGRRQFKHDDWR
jgi:hypothetical protein